MNQASFFVSEYKFDRREQLFWQALLAVEGVGLSAVIKVNESLLALGVDWTEFWHRPEFIGPRCGLNATKMARLLDFKTQFSPESWWEYLQTQNISIITIFDTEYPALLKEVSQPPLLLYAKGTSNGWNRLPIAVVGTRQITPYGQLVTETLTRQLVTAGASIISGAMYGVDVLAHETTIKNGGYTVGVLGYGFQYAPKVAQNSVLAAILESGGALISEFTPMTPPLKYTFPQRNRIIAGMSVATIVTEAAQKSGSHITAEFAADFGRIVGAVPGPITNRYSQGTQWLINQGAILVNSAEDVLSEVGGSMPTQLQNVKVATITNSLERQIYQTIADQASSSDTISTVLNKPVHEVASALTQLELRGILKRQAETWFLAA